MPNKYLDSVQLGRLITKIKTYVNTAVAGLLPTSGGSITGNLTVSGTITGDVTGDLTGNADTATNATNDANGNPIAGTYLPLAGGSMTGGIASSGNALIGKTDNGYINIFAGTDNTSPYIALYGKNHSSYAGRVTIRANDGTNARSLFLHPTGNILWGSDAILTDATVGKVVSKDISSASVTLAVTTAKTITSISLTAGTWVVTGNARFTSVTADKTYGVSITKTANQYLYAAEGTVALHTGQNGTAVPLATSILTLTSTTTVYLCGYGTATATITDAHLTAVRIV